MSGTFALEYAPQIAKDNGPYVIDNSSAFRYDDHIPLVVPEINAAAIKADDRLIANPNCTTAIAVMALFPLHQRFGIRRIICSTYQARRFSVVFVVVVVFVVFVGCVGEEGRRGFIGISYNPHTYTYPISSSSSLHPCVGAGGVGRGRGGDGGAAHGHGALPHRARPQCVCACVLWI